MTVDTGLASARHLAFIDQKIAHYEDTLNE
jgi:hypothetical protein